MSYFRSRRLEQARVLANRRDFTDEEIIAIRRMVAKGQNIREIAAAFPLAVGLPAYRQKLLKLGIHARRATSDVRCGDNVHRGDSRRMADVVNARPYRPMSVRP